MGKSPFCFLRAPSLGGGAYTAPDMWIPYFYGTPTPVLEHFGLRLGPENLSPKWGLLTPTVGLFCVTY